MAKSLTKEKEKLCRVEEIFQSLIEVKEEVSKKIEKLPPQFNLLENIRNKNSNNSLQRFETYNSDLLHYLLNIKRENLNFTKLFLEYLQNEKKLKFDFDLNKINYKNIKVDKEYYTTVKIEEEGIEKNGRIDILIHCNINNKETKKSFTIIIENKINADDQDKQLERYYKYISKTKGYGNNVYVIYLTPIIKPPREYSFSEKYIKKVGEKFKNITHGDIGRWLENILKNKEYNFLHKNDFRLLKSALIQMVDNEKSISGENEEDNMKEKRIKQILEDNILKKINTKEIKIEEEFQLYINVFSKAKDLLEMERKRAIIEKIIPNYLDFTKKISKYLKNNKYFNIYKPKEIIDNLTSGELLHHIDSEYLYLQSDIDFNNKSVSSYCFGVCGLPDINNKIRKSVQNIFNNKFKDNKKDWDFFYKIDINNDKPEEIAKAMIDLYELLKKEIK
ncbi:PD-(D/E)XK nuclease family protein [uncultured Brachyspira sp.]|uniref:PDDEXK-like family protein n=1 Tax=uncultured Brachyspira sp. TaxID=221953 RepID=UPI00258FB438|nr:PD-(D/E)XK nuclease family protein [uncultured Brachyspira sp.]